MIYFEAVIRPQRAEALCLGLVEAEWVEEVTAVEVLGSGRHRGTAGGGDLLPKVVVAGAVADERREDLIQLVLRHTRVGRDGDGKLYLFADARIVES